MVPGLGVFVDVGHHLELLGTEVDEMLELRIHSTLPNPLLILELPARVVSRKLALSICIE